MSDGEARFWVTADGERALRHAAALERARAAGIRVARLSEEAWRVESSEPALRGPYMILLAPYDTADCQCQGGGFGTVCHHRAAVAAAIEGDYPVSDLGTIRGPAGCAAEQGAHVYAPPAWVQARNAAYEAGCADRRASAPPLTADDYDLFDQ